MAFRRKAKSSDASATQPAKTSRTGQIKAAYRLTRAVDPKVGWITLGAGLGPVALFLLIGLLINQPVYLTIFGVMTGLLVATTVFGRRAEKAAFDQVEGQPGAAVAAMNMLRRGWVVQPAIAVTRNQDVVHRAVGRPGVVLVGEGQPSRLANLIANEKRKVARVAPEVPVYDYVVGTGEGQVELRKLNRTLMKLPRNLKPYAVTEINRRLKALGANQPPIPKGPLPRGARIPRAPRG